LFDPIKSGQGLVQSLSKGQLTPLRKPLSQLAAKDCQLILCTRKSLTKMEQQALKQSPKVLTAAEAAVKQAMERGF
jgi:hypothetical protein